jgi:hypothetical protein
VNLHDPKTRQRVLVGSGIAAAAVAFLYMRHKGAGLTSSATGATAPTVTDPNIDPATGIPYALEASTGNPLDSGAGTGSGGAAVTAADGPANSYDFPIGTTGANGATGPRGPRGKPGHPPHTKPKPGHRKPKPKPGQKPKPKSGRPVVNPQHPPAHQPQNVRSGKPKTKTDNKPVGVGGKPKPKVKPLPSVAGGGGSTMRPS